MEISFNSTNYRNIEPLVSAVDTRRMNQRNSDRAWTRRHCSLRSTNEDGSLRCQNFPSRRIASLRMETKNLRITRHRLSA